MKLPEQLLPQPLPPDPLPIASQWLAEAWERRVQPNPDAMVLATSDAQGRPSARVVLCKQLVAPPGYLLFYTNYESRKGRELEENPHAGAVLHWDTMHRQVRIEGPVTKATPEESDRYFDSRAWQRRIGAWASRQSEPVASRDELLHAVEQVAERFKTPDPLADDGAETIDTPIPRPPHWGGYRLWIESIELWVEGAFRIHDRARWSRELERRDANTFAAGAWTATRLHP